MSSKPSKDEEMAVAEAGVVPSPSKAWSRKYLALGSLFVVANVVAVTVPLVLRVDDDDEKRSGDPMTPAGGNSAGKGAPNITAFSVFYPELPNFDANILNCYATEEDFAKGVTAGLQSLLDRVVGRNTGQPGYENLAMGMPPPGEAMNESAALAPEGDDRNVGGVDDFGTNNLDGGVEKGDKVVANESFMYIAYGDHVVVVDPSTGIQVTEIRLPPIKNTERDKNEEPGEEPPTDPTRPLSMAAYWNMPTIQSMLLLDDKLVVIASGYGNMHLYGTTHAIDSYLATRTLVYDVSAIGTSAAATGNMDPLAFKDLSGYFLLVLAIERNVHVVTSSSIYYQNVIMPFETWNNPELKNMTEEAYTSYVLDQANAKVIPDFVKMLTDDVKVDGKLPRFAQVNTFDDGSGAGVAPIVYPDGYMKSIAFVYSFDITTVANSLTGQNLTGVEASGAIVPAYSPTVYASQDTMIIATSGTGWYEAKNATVSKTYLMSFKLSGASSVPRTVGSAFGDILNQYSMHVVDGVLRIATTIRTSWFWGIPEMPNEEAVETLEEKCATETNSAGSDAATEPNIGDPPADITEESSTENYVITIKIDGTDEEVDAETPNVMQQLDQLKIGKPNESITAVRFFDKYAYVVTFEQTDPFYKLDVSQPTNIVQLEEISITGFSQYLHAYDDTEEMIFALREEATNEGQVLGLQISLFDLRVPNDPKVMRHNIEVDPDTRLNSEALWDKNAVRYNKKYNLLIIPLNINTWPDRGHFNGFKIFFLMQGSCFEGPKISENAMCSVQFNQGDSVTTDGFYCASLSPRSMIFDGKMVVMKDHFLASKDLQDACVVEWETTIQIDFGNETMCGVW